MIHSLVQIRPRSLPAGLDPIGPLGFGTWRFTTDDLGAAHELVETALDVGMNLIDTADVYGLDYDGSGFGGNEELLGKVLAQAPHLLIGDAAQNDGPDRLEKGVVSKIVGLKRLEPVHPAIRGGDVAIQSDGQVESELRGRHVILGSLES
ncbi:MAG: aldo/keto reductase, partial [Acidimicrobiales bacterium]